MTDPQYQQERQRNIARNEVELARKRLEDATSDSNRWGEDIFGYEARRQFKASHGAYRSSEPVTTIQVRSLYTADWSENHEA
jgi:hypothetical protein